MGVEVGVERKGDGREGLVRAGGKARPSSAEASMAARAAP